MIKWIILAVFVLGCILDGAEDYKNASVVWVGGCQYVVVEGGICHKGDCNNPAHK